MDKPIIQFQKSDIDQIDKFFENFFSKRKSSLVYINNKFNPYPGGGARWWGIKSYNTRWGIFTMDEDKVIGDITYQSSPQIDSLIFNYSPEFSEFIQQLITEIKIWMDKTGFTLITNNFNLNGSQVLIQGKSKYSDSSDISSEEWGKYSKKEIEDIEPNMPMQPKTEEDIQNLLNDTKSMKKYYKDYNATTARSILKAIPSAWKKKQRAGGRWGPGIISKSCHLNSTTVGRYLKAFYKVGLREIEKDGEMIEIPYTPKFASNSSNSPSNL